MGFSGCPNALFSERSFHRDIEKLLSRINFDKLFKDQVSEIFRKHHRVIISASCCPNACSRPQIADIGLIGAESIDVTETQCTFCEACIKICDENAITLEKTRGPVIQEDKCLDCGKCPLSCLEGKIISSQKGFRVLIGGKLGRHPVLAEEMPGIYNYEETMRIIEKGLLLLLKNNKEIKKMADLFNLYDKKALFEMLIQ